MVSLAWRACPARIASRTVGPQYTPFQAAAGRVTGPRALALMLVANCSVIREILLLDVGILVLTSSID